MIGTHLISPRHGSTLINRFGPAHHVAFQGCFFSTPGAEIFGQPTSGVNTALDWHAGTFATKVANCFIQGSITLRGFGMEIVNNTIETPSTADGGDLGCFDCFNMGMPLDCLIAGNKIIIRRHRFDGGDLFHLNGSADWDMDGGEKGALIIANNHIEIYATETHALIEIVETTAKTPDTGSIIITGNVVTHAAVGTSAPFLEINITDGQRCVVTNNYLPSNITLGTVSGFSETITYPNHIAGHLTYQGIPTLNPAGSDRLWSDGGTLKVT